MISVQSRGPRPEHPLTLLPVRQVAGDPVQPGSGKGAGRQKEEEDAGEEGGEEGGQDAVRHPADVHPHLDAVQHPSAAQAPDGVHRLHPARAVGLLLLPVLHQQHHQPHVLRAVQRVLPPDLRPHPQVQVAHPQPHCYEPRLLQLRSRSRPQQRGGLQLSPARQRRPQPQRFLGWVSRALCVVREAGREARTTPGRNQ